MDNLDKIYETLEKNGFKISTDTRKELAGSIYFAIKGENFDGNTFVEAALKGGASGVVTEREDVKDEKVYPVKNVLNTLQKLASKHRKLFKIPIMVIGGSNGKTTSKELVSHVLRKKYKVCSTKESLNNHIGVPLSVLSLRAPDEIGVFEIGANHPGEHTELLDIIRPTMVIVTNNGMDHLEGFGSPKGVRKANKEIYDWAKENEATAFVNKNHPDLVEDSASLERILYPAFELEVNRLSPLALRFEGKEYQTNLAGGFNKENIELALALGKHFNIGIEKSLEALGHYKPSLKRSEFIVKDGIRFIADCYNANPSSMILSLESFLESSEKPRGIILGDMLELGSYAEREHEKIIEFISDKEVDQVVLIGENLGRAIQKMCKKYQWFKNSDEARDWFEKQDFKSFTFLLKGSRGIAVEKAVGL